MVFPQILKCSKIPKDNDAGTENIDIMINNMQQALSLDILNLSTRVAQGPSIMLIPEVTAAQNSNTKNAADIRLPPLI